MIARKRAFRKMIADRLNILTDRYLFNTISKEELHELHLLLQDPAMKLIAEERLLAELSGNAYKIDADLSSLQQKIINRVSVINMPEQQHVAKIHFLKAAWFRYAAVAIVIFGIGSAVVMFLKNSRNAGNDARHTIAKTPINSTQPGENKVVLILEDGTSIDLNESKKGFLASKSGISIKKDENSRIVYGIPGGSEPIGSENVKYHTVIIPRGREYQLVLADGTRVWLNAESSLKFPPVFKGQERRVELTGEAYFEVAKNKHMPFMVSASGTDVEVLGTSFNVNAYSEAVTTTLINGSVKLKNISAQVILKPGQSGIIKDQGSFKVKTADIESTMAWKNGYFVFHDENIKSIMDKVARWYDIDVEYRGDVNGIDLYGKIARTENITDLLKNLQQTKIVNIKMEGRRVIVMP